MTEVQQILDAAGNPLINIAWKPRKRTDVEIEEIASGIFSGKIFCDKQIPPEENERVLGSVFMPISLGAFLGWSDADMQSIGMFYEYIVKGGPRDVVSSDTDRGYPSFCSMEVLAIDDAQKVLDRMADLKKEQKENTENEKGEDGI